MASAMVSGTCSGEPQQPVGVQIRIDRTAHRVGQRAVGIRQRAGAVVAGAAAEGRGQEGGE
eukprot:2421460-Prymnesium_polylepis.1